LVLLAGLVLALLTATSARSADKPFSVVFSGSDGSQPATLPAGSTGTIRATYKNLTTQQRLGSSNLVPPSGLTIVSASVSQGSATLSGGVLQLRNLNLAPGATATVTLQVSASGTGCTTATYLWPAPVTKQANNFNGPPGNNLNLDETASDMRTVVGGGACGLRFVTQPAHARINQAITGSAFDPSGPAVSVEVIDDAGQRVTGSTAPVTIAIGANAGGGTLGGTKTVSASGGVASFSTLSIDKQGAGYTLVASSPGLTSATSDPFTIAQFAVSCTEDVDCSLSLNLTSTNQSIGGSSSVEVTALQGAIADTDAGFLTTSLGIGGGLDCSGYVELTSDVITVDYSALQREKRVVATIAKKVMQTDTNNGASFLEQCFGAPYTFATDVGTPLEVNSDYVPGPYPAPEYKGLLPDCGGSAQLDDPDTPGVSGPVISNAGPPCVAKRKKTASGSGFIESLWPSGQQVGVADPRGRF
jgi:hypothetical protein